MNFADFDGNLYVKEELNSLENSRRFPHAIIINGSSPAERDKLVSVLSKWAVCKSDEKPCSTCIPCEKASKGIHPDVYYAKGSGKTDSISVDEIRNINQACSIIPNEADIKVFILKDADKRMNAEALNAFLKTLEEPPQAILFLLTTEDAGSLPQTILSRCTVLNLENTVFFSEEDIETAGDLLLSATELSELPLLKGMWNLSSKETALALLPVMRTILSDALSLSVSGEALVSKEYAQTLSQKLTKKKIISLIEAVNNAIYIISRNANLALLSTWLCGEFRRIIWQK